MLFVEHFEQLAMEEEAISVSFFVLRSLEVLHQFHLNLLESVGLAYCRQKTK